MSTVTPKAPSRNYTALVIGTAVALAVVTAVALGGNYLWQRTVGPTLASKADCTLAQELFDKAQTAPSDPTEADALEKEIRKVRYTQMRDEGLSTQVGKYARWAVVKSTGTGDKPTTKQLEDVLKEAKGHCRESGVTLVIPALAF